VVRVSLRVVCYARGQRRVQLESCPVCGYDYDRNEDRHEHIEDHDPEDFGLSPLGQTAEDHSKPLFTGGLGD